LVELIAGAPRPADDGRHQVLRPQAQLVIGWHTRLGADHPDTAHSLSNLASVLRDQGDLDQARTLYKRALSIRKARLGPDHPDTMRSRERLAVAVVALENRQ
jgi:hypothetical protein